MGQFLAPAAILGIGVIGLWLLGGKKSTTSAPDSMPKLNSGLRGTTMPITFGTNKVSAQITWSKNWNPSRQRSPGKGKGGGSGGFGAAKGGGAAGQQYIYYWDLMFHYGMFDVPSAPNRGWIGTDTIDPLVMSALTSGFSESVAALLPITTLVNNKSATLSYTEAFIGTALPTGDPNLTSWSHFVAEEGVNCMFPYTGWIGFDQLELGPTPSVPQLFIEWVPIDPNVGFQEGGGFLSKTTKNDIHDIACNPGFVTGDNGLLYHIDNTSGSNRLYVSEINGATQVVLTDGTIQNDLNTELLSSYTVSPSAGFPVGGKYMYVFGSVAQGGTFGLFVSMYRVENDGTLTYESSSVHLGAFSSAIFPSKVLASGTINTDEVAIAYSDSGNLQPHIFVAPSYVNLLASGTGITVSDMSNRLVSPTGIGASYFCSPQTYDDVNDKMHFSIISSTDGLATNNRIYAYFPKQMMKWQADNTSGAGWNSYLHDKATTTHPNGMMWRYDLISLGAGVASGMDVGPVDDFGTMPFSDVGLDSAGGAGTTVDDYTVPIYSDGAIFMTRRFSDNNYLAKTRVFVYNPLTDEMTSLGTVQAEFASSSDYLGSPHNIKVVLNNNDLYIVCTPLGTVGTVIANFAYRQSDALDVTPAYIIYRILTHPAFGTATQALFGFTVTEERIDQSSYLAAVAECESQGCKISATYDQTGNLLDIFNDLLQLYGGYLTESDGIISFGVVRNSDTPVRVIDNDHLVAERGKPPVKVSKAALEDGYNKVSFTYLDRSLDYGQNQVIQSDEVDMDLNGPRPKDWNTRFVMAGSLANQIAVRALWSNLYGRDTYEFTTGWKDFDLRPGDLVTLVDSFDPLLNHGARVRLLKRSATDKVGSYKWQAVQDYDYINTATAAYSQISSISGGPGSIIEPAQPPMWQTAYELSQEFQGSQAEVYFAYGQGFYAMGAQLHISLDGTNYLLADDVQPFPITGVLAAPLENRPKGYVEEKVDFWLFPTSPFNTSSPAFVQEYTLDDVTAAIREAGGGVLVIGSEALPVQGLTLLAQNHYRASKVFRGWGGTPISAHNSGAYFSAHGAGIFAHDITPDDVGTTISYKIAPYNFAGKVVDVTSIAANTYTIKGNYWRAREQPTTRLWVNSAISWPSSRQLTGPYIGVTSGGCSLIATWPLADNAEGFGAGGFGAGTFGHFIMADSVGWRVDVYSSNGAAVSSFVVNTGFFNYTVAQNSADFNGFGRNLILRVTPFTIKGDGPVSDTRSISLNW